MPLPAVNHWRHSVFGLPVSTCLCDHIVECLKTQCLKNACKILPVYNFDAVGDKDELK